MININFPRQIKKENIEIEFLIFLIGIFFLPSAPFFGSLLLIFPLTIGIKNNLQFILKDKLNYLLFVASLLMLFKCIVTSSFDLAVIENWDSSLNWIGLGNWIPLFIFYLGIQNYVRSSARRKILAKVLILGTVPVIFSCFSQYFLKWYGPYEFLNGFIVWFQRPRTEVYQPITGLFNNPNYAGAWLAMIWPFLISYLYEKGNKNNKYKFILIFCFSILFIISVFLINSRGAFLAILLSLPLIFGRSVFTWLIPFIFFMFIAILVCILPIFAESIRNIFCFLIPNSILGNFNDLTISFENLPRLLIWQKAISFITEKPLLGWGAASFPILYFSQTGLWMGHPHNLFLELSLSYGLMTSIMIFSFIGIIIFKSSKIIYDKQIKNKNFERAWFCSAIAFLIIHLFDVVYFDLRISIIFWTLIAGLRGITIPQRSSINKNYQK